MVACIAYALFAIAACIAVTGGPHGDYQPVSRNAALGLARNSRQAYDRASAAAQVEGNDTELPVRRLHATHALRPPNGSSSEATPTADEVARQRTADEGKSAKEPVIVK